MHLEVINCFQPLTHLSTSCKICCSTNVSRCCNLLNDNAAFCWIKILSTPKLEGEESGVGTSIYRLHRYMLPDRVLLLRLTLNRVSLLPLLALCSRFDPYKTGYLNCQKYPLKFNCVNVQLQQPDEKLIGSVKTEQSLRVILKRFHQHLCAVIRFSKFLFFLEQSVILMTLEGTHLSAKLQILGAVIVFSVLQDCCPFDPL